MASQDAAGDYPTSRLGQMRSTRATRTNENMSLTDEEDNDGSYYDQESGYTTTHDHIMPLKLNESWAARRLLEALRHLPPNHDKYQNINSSNSAPMRFQQKTQEEQQQRRQELHNTQSATAIPSRAASTRLVGNGKVRQMFDERRRGAGIDRSNPLKPIGEADQLAKGLSTMSLKEKPVSGGRAISDRNNNNSSSKYNASGTVSNANRLRPVITRKTPPKKDQPDGKTVTASPPLRSIRTKLMPQQPTTNARTAAVRAPVTSEKGRTTPPKVRPIIPKSPVTKIQMDTLPPEGTATCRFCGRHFNTDRLGKHEEVCQRTMNTKRRIFDASKQRVQGTDTEKFSKQSKKPAPARSQSTYSSAAQQQGLSTGVKKSNWRKKHEEFIEAIRAAKKVQAHLARGGKLSDLPPPPPSENPDYIQCPHCGRRFNQQAAERHIPRCETMVHNKPRRSNPQVAAKKR